jgi:hypothetical protein
MYFLIQSLRLRSDNLGPEDGTHLSKHVAYFAKYGKRIDVLWREKRHISELTHRTGCNTVP